MNIIMGVVLSLVLSIPAAHPKFYQITKSCETLSEIKLNPSEEEPMKPVTVSLVLTNCSPLDKVYRAVGGEMSKCGHALVFADGEIPLKSGQSVPISAECTSAPDSCPGDVSIAVIVYDGETKIAQRDAILKSK